MTTPTISAALDAFQQAANRGTAVYLSLELVQELRDALETESDADALAARPLMEQMAAMADCIGANTVGQITAISNRAAAWLRQNPPGQPVAIEPRGCPTPGACSCVEPASPAPERDDAWWHELISEIARVQHVALGEGQGPRFDLAEAVVRWCRPPALEAGEVQKHVTHDHELKVWGSFFEALLDGTKNFEVRHNDRDFKPGDYLLLREWVENECTGRELIKCVTYVLQGGIFGVEAGYVVLALAAKQTNAMQRLLSASMDARGYLDLCTPTPPAPAPELGEVGELVNSLGMISDGMNALNHEADSWVVARAATLLQQQSAELAALRGAPKPEEVAAFFERLRDAVCTAVAEALGRAYDCQRVWEAWNVGTMGPDDFTLTAEDDDRVAEIADAAIEAFRSFQVPALQAGEGQPPHLTFLDAIRLAEGCHDYSGGHSGQQGEAFQDGIGTVVTVLKKAAVGPWDSQTLAVFGVGSAPQVGEVQS